MPPVRHVGALMCLVSDLDQVERFSLRSPLSFGFRGIAGDGFHGRIVGIPYMPHIIIDAMGKRVRSNAVSAFIYSDVGQLNDNGSGRPICFQLTRSIDSYNG